MDDVRQRPPLDRLTVERIEPSTPSRTFPTKAVVGERIDVSADILADGHDRLAARVCWRPAAREQQDRKLRQVGLKGYGWQVAPLHEVVNDGWEGAFVPNTVGLHQVVIQTWRDRFATWRHDIEVRYDAGQELEVELAEGALTLRRLATVLDGEDRRRVEDAADALCRTTCSIETRLNAGLDDRVARLVAPIPDVDVTVVEATPLWVDRPRALTGAWYEFFPRSEGGLQGAAKRLAAVADMGFDVVYLPPIHPIGTTARKGRGNTLSPGRDDPGSPWAIGSSDGGHTAIDPGLGTLEDFRTLMAEAADQGLEVALDYALQCSPDHPWVTDHPEWFWHRPDGTIRYAENPPKKYQDIYPINFWPEDDADREALWEACLGIFRYWIAEGVRIFRVDNPHTKPLAFWTWILGEVRRDHPDVIFLSEAFTAPKMMARLAEVGFSQSYTYFTWRNHGHELREYVEELAYGPTSSYLRPNFWPNTPDILSGPLRNGPPAAFRMRFILAATLVPSYGMYSGFELYENEPASDHNEEYLNSEKYELKERDWDRRDSLAPYIARVNEIRRRHEAFGWLRNIRFHHSDNDAVLVYSKGTAADGDVVLVVVSLHPHRPQETTLGLDLAAMGLPHEGAFLVHDELTGETYQWQGPTPYVRLDPSRGQVAHILSFPVRG